MTQAHGAENVHAQVTFLQGIFYLIFSRVIFDQETSASEIFFFSFLT